MNELHGRQEDELAAAVAVDDALVRVQRVYPYDTWRTAELRDIVGLAIQRPARIPRPRDANA